MRILLFVDYLERKYMKMEVRDEEDVDIATHRRKIGNWVQQRQAFERDLEHFMEENAHLKAKLVEQEQSSEQEYQELCEDEERLVRRPIVAVFRSFGQSLPYEDVPTEDTLISRRALLLSWTGCKNFDRFCHDIDWPTSVVRTGPKPTFNNREELLISLIVIRRGFRFLI